MGSVSEDEDGAEKLNSSKKKRTNEETKRRNLRSKKPRTSESIDETVEVLGENGGQEKETKNENEEFEPVVADKRAEIIDIVSDSDDESEEETNDKRNSEEIELEIANAHLLLGLMENFGRSSSANIARKFTRGEKGKAKACDFFDSSPEHDNSHLSGYSDSGPENEQRFQESSGQLENYGQELVILNDEQQYENHNAPAEPRRPSPSPAERERIQRQLVTEMRHRREMRERFRRDRLKTARTFAWSEEYHEASSNQEKRPSEDDELLGKSTGPFSLALKMVRERKTKDPKLLLKWKPSYKSYNAYRTIAPSLLDLSLKAIAMNVETIVSLELFPDLLRQRLADTLCNLRKMNIRTLELFVKASPTEIRIKDCSWLTEEYFSNTFQNFDAKNLMVLQLDLCGQCVLDYLLSKTLARFSRSLPKLGILSLKGAARLSDNGLKPLVSSAPALQSINLSHCSLLTHAGINILAATFGSTLKELYIENCQKIDAMLVLPALKKFEHLEVLSVAGIQTVSDQFVHGLITTCGRKIKELDLADCEGLTNYSLEVIGDATTNLHALNISNLDKVTDLGLRYLADGCRSIRSLKLCRNKFSDEAIAAFLKASGESLIELSLNKVSLVGPCTAFSLAKCSRKLLSLDLSWCRKITDEELGLIVDSCLSLKLVKLFGCTQITNVFLDGHSNPVVRVIGLKLTPIMDYIDDIVEPQGVLLRNSPLACL